MALIPDTGPLYAGLDRDDAVVERLNEPKLATLDRRHFGMLRPRHVDALVLLPEPLRSAT